MKPPVLLSAAAFAVLSTVSLQAAYVENFDSFNSTGGASNFAPQGTWTITDPELDVSFLQLASAYGQPGKAVGLGGFLSEPAGKIVRLSTTVSEALAVSRFSVDYALINRYAGGAGTFYTEDDRFGFVLSDSSGDLLNIDFNPTGVEDVRQVSVNGVAITPNGVVASDYNTPAWYNLGISFAANGGNLDYSLTTAGGTVTYSGSLAGKAGAVLTSISMEYEVLQGVAGSNYMVVDNLSIPEPSSAITLLGSLGALALRRNRRK